MCSKAEATGKGPGLVMPKTVWCGLKRVALDAAVAAVG